MRLFTFNLKFKQKLIIIFLFIAIIPSTFLTMVMFTNNQQTISKSKTQIEDHQLKTLSGLSSEYSDIINSWVFDQSKIVSMFAQDPTLRSQIQFLPKDVLKSGALSLIRVVFDNWLQTNPTMSQVLLLNYTSGETILSLNNYGLTNSSSQDPTSEYMSGAIGLEGLNLQTDGVYFKEPYISNYFNSFEIGFSKVVRPSVTDSSDPTEILVIISSPTPLFDLIAPRDTQNQSIDAYYQSIGLGTTGEMFLLNNKGIAISRSRFSLNDSSFILQQNDANVAGFKTALEHGITLGKGKNYLNKDIHGSYVYLGFNTTGSDQRESFLKNRLHENLPWVLVIEIDQSEVLSPITQIQQEQTSSLIILLGIIVLLAIAVTVFSIFMANSFSKPVVNISEISNAIATGDLTVDVEAQETKDEIGSLKTSFATMISFLRPAIQSIATIAQTLGTSSQQMATSSEEVTASSEEMSSISQQISKGAQTQTDYLGSSKNEIHEMQQDLATKIQSIKVASELIQSISSQVNMLALNASIEAARAGEYGRGFSVVAENIRKLADETKVSVGKVDAIIQDLSTAITHRISNLQSSMDNVISVAEETSASAQEASAATEQQSATMEELSASAQQLAKFALDLEDIVNQFRLD